LINRIATRRERILLPKRWLGDSQRDAKRDRLSPIRV